MHGTTRLALAKLLGLSQSSIATQLGTTRHQVFRWAHGHRPIPDRYVAPLEALLVAALAEYCTRRPAECTPTPHAKIVEAMHLLAQAVETDMVQRPADSSAPLADILDELATFRTMPLTALAERANAERLRTLGAFLQTYGDIVCQLAPFFFLLMDKEILNGRNGFDGHEDARAATPGAHAAYVGALAE